MKISIGKFKSCSKECLKSVLNWGTQVVGGRRATIVIHKDDIVCLYGTVAIMMVPLLTAFKAGSVHKVLGWALAQAEKENGLDDMTPSDTMDRTWSNARDKKMMIRAAEIMNEALDDMIYAFTRLRDQDEDFLADAYPLTPDEDPRVARGLMLFATHFRNLWL